MRHFPSAALLSSMIAAAILRRDWSYHDEANRALASASCLGSSFLSFSRVSASMAMAGFLILLPCHWCGAMGGGDVKLMAAYGALLGPSGILLAAVFTAVFGGLSAAGASLCNRRAPAVPYAPAIVLGAWISLLGGGS